MIKHKVTISVSSYFDTKEEAMELYDEYDWQYQRSKVDEYSLTYNKIDSNKVLKVTINNCQRCQDIHIDQEFKLLDNPVDDYHYFSICPYTVQPILLKVEEEAN